MHTTNKAVTIINAEDLILGRMSSIIAKRLLKGEKITIVKAEKTVLSGKKKSRVSEKKEFLEAGHPKKGPFHYRRPDRIVASTVRGMLPYKKPRGKQAYKRFKAFIGVPKELKNIKTETLAEAHAEKLKYPYFTLSELAKEIGWDPGE